LNFSSYFPLTLSSLPDQLPGERIIPGLFLFYSEQREGRYLVFAFTPQTVAGTVSANPLVFAFTLSFLPGSLDFSGSRRIFGACSTEQRAL
jgi:hypothetical protein